MFSPFCLPRPPRPRSLRSQPTLLLLCCAALCAGASAQSVTASAPAPSAAKPRSAPLPARNISIEIRTIEETSDDSPRYTAGPAADSTALEQQSLQVRNGEKAQLQRQQSQPMQWLQSASSARPKSPVPAAANPSVAQGMVWLDSGHRLSVQPRWSRGASATLDIDLEQSQAEERSGADLPAQHTQRVSTSLIVPLAQWVTLAASGNPAPPSGHYRSQAPQQARRLLQIRVMVL